MKTTHNYTKNPRLLEPVKEPFKEQGCISMVAWDKMTGRPIKKSYAISYVDRIERNPSGYIADPDTFFRRVDNFIRESKENIDFFAAAKEVAKENWYRLPSKVYLKSGDVVLINNSLGEYVGSNIPLIRTAETVSSDETVEVEASDHNGNVKTIAYPLKEIEAIFTYHKGPIQVFKDKAEIHCVIHLKSGKFVLITNRVEEFVQYPIKLQILPGHSYLTELRKWDDLQLLPFDYTLAINDLPDAVIVEAASESVDEPETTTDVATQK